MSKNLILSNVIVANNFHNSIFNYSLSYLTLTIDSILSYLLFNEVSLRYKL